MNNFNKLFVTTATAAIVFSTCHGTIAQEGQKEIVWRVKDVVVKKQEFNSNRQVIEWIVEIEIDPSDPFPNWIPALKYLSADFIDAEGVVIETEFPLFVEGKGSIRRVILNIPPSYIWSRTTKVVVR